MCVAQEIFSKLESCFLRVEAKYRERNREQIQSLCNAQWPYGFLFVGDLRPPRFRRRDRPLRHRPVAHRRGRAGGRKGNK